MDSVHNSNQSVINNASMCDSVAYWLRRLDREVAGSTLTLCAIQYGPAQAVHSHLTSVAKRYNKVLAKG